MFAFHSRTAEEATRSERFAGSVASGRLLWGGQMGLWKSWGGTTGIRVWLVVDVINTHFILFIFIFYIIFYHLYYSIFYYILDFYFRLYLILDFILLYLILFYYTLYFILLYFIFLYLKCLYYILFKKKFFI